MANQGSVDGRKRLAYEESIRALTLQSSVLDDLRARTGILLTAASLTATFVGSRALDDGFTTWTRVALGFFLATGGFCLGVLWPRGDWNFAFDAQAILDGYVNTSDGATLDEMYVRFAEINQKNWKSNTEKIRWLFWSFRLAVLALVLQVPCWLAAIGNAHG
jgi:hypothetical protein